MKAIPLLVGACLFTSGALAQSVPEMQKMANEWQAAFNNGDAATVASFYKDDAVVFPPGGDMVKGKQAIQSLWTEAAKGLQIANFKVTDVRSLGPNAAREQGYATIKTRGDNPQEMLGKYVVIWEKVDGKWKLDSDIWNMNGRPETMKTAAGSGDIYWSVTFSIPPGKMDNFKQVVAKLVDETKKEPGTLEYEYTANNEQNTVDIIERYQDSNAAVQHVTRTFAKYAKEFLENAQVGRFVVYGSPNDEVKRVLKDFNPVYFSAFDGFTR